MGRQLTAIGWVTFAAALAVISPAFTLAALVILAVVAAKADR